MNSPGKDVTDCLFNVTVSFGTLFLVLVTRAKADNSSVAIGAPTIGRPETAITIMTTATRDAEGIFHYTNWHSLVFNREETARRGSAWRRSPASNPPFSFRAVCNL